MYNENLMKDFSPIGSLITFPYASGGRNFTAGGCKFMLCDGRWVPKYMLPELYELIGDMYNPIEKEVTRKGIFRRRVVTLNKVQKPNHFCIPNLLPIQNGEPYIPAESEYHTFVPHYVRVK